MIVSFTLFEVTDWFGMNLTSSAADILVLVFCTLLPIDVMCSVVSSSWSID